MRAVVHNGPRDVAVQNVPDAKIGPTHVMVRITTTNICGSDLLMSKGRTDVPKGGVFEDENLGQVVEMGNLLSRGPLCRTGR